MIIEVRVIKPNGATELQMVNTNYIARIFQWEHGSRMFLMGDEVLKCSNSYEEISKLIKEAQDGKYTK